MNGHLVTAMIREGRGGRAGRRGKRDAAVVVPYVSAHCELTVNVNYGGRPWPPGSDLRCW